MKTKGNDPAFNKTGVEIGFTEPTYGLTKREYFAAIALGGLLAHNSMLEVPVSQAVKMADRLIQELNRKEDSSG